MSVIVINFNSISIALTETYMNNWCNECKSQKCKSEKQKNNMKKKYNIMRGRGEGTRNT